MKEIDKATIVNYDRINFVNMINKVRNGGEDHD